VAPGEEKPVIGLVRIGQSIPVDPGRFIISFHEGYQRIYISEGCAAEFDFFGESDKTVIPVHAQLDGKYLDGTLVKEDSDGGSSPLERPFWSVVDESILPDTTYRILLRMDSGEALLSLSEASASTDGSGEEEDGFFEIGTIILSSPSGEVANGLLLEKIDQKWASDVPFHKRDSSSSSSSGSSSSGSSSSEPSSSEPSSSEPSDGGSSKDSAIVPASWSALGFVKLFTSESPEVVFHDYLLDIPVSAESTVLTLDHRFLEVCEEGSIRATGYTSDKTYPLGICIERGNLVLHASPMAKARPAKVQIQITGTRKGFLGLRFPLASRAEFEWNERRLNPEPRPGAFPQP
jgi:hypothetical protein